MIVGVYPSAWHVSWRAPSYLASDDRRGAVAAMAVDVEPTVFWNGDDAKFAEELRHWIRDVGFIEGDEPGSHGYLSPVSPPSNGSSGVKVEREYLEPLGLTPGSASFTDVYPAFVVKRSAGTRREQGNAIDHEYDPIASSLGFPTSSLPARPTPKRLVREAAETFRERLVEDLGSEDPGLVVTLGDEAMQVVRAIPALGAKHASQSLVDLYGER